MGYLDETGLSRVWNRIKAYIQSLNYTSNIGTITGITMNGSSKGTSGVVDLGSVVTDISGCMPITGSITDSTNLSNITAGVYSIEGITHSDFPTNPIYGTLIQGTGQYKPQILIGGGTGASNIYTRRWLTGSSSWTAWTDYSVPTNIVTGLNSSGTATAYTVWVGTQQQYDNILTKDSSTLYFIKGV